MQFSMEVKEANSVSLKIGIVLSLISSAFLFIVVNKVFLEFTVIEVVIIFDVSLIGKLEVV